MANLSREALRSRLNTLIAAARDAYDGLAASPTEARAAARTIILREKLLDDLAPVATKRIRSAKVEEPPPVSGIVGEGGLVE